MLANKLYIIFKWIQKSKEIFSFQKMGMGFVIFISLYTSIAWADLTAESVTQRNQFKQAESAFSKGNQTLYQKLKKDLIRYPLYPYLLFAEYEKNIQNLTSEEFQQFMSDYPDSPLANQLRSRWLATKAKQEDWPAFLKAFVPTDDTALQCHFYWAELHNQKDKMSVLEQVKPLWLIGKDPPYACEAIFKVFEESPTMTRSMVWQRIKNAISNGNQKLARAMIKHIKGTEVALVELWLMVRHNPHLVTQRKYFNHQHPAILEILVDGVCLIAKEKPETAILIWQQIGRQYEFNERHWGMVVRAIGLAFAKQRHTEAERWLAKVPLDYANNEVHEWRIRVAIAKEDWPTVLHWQKQLPEELASNESWGYWQARALEKIGRIKESQSILARIAQVRSYYGFLASQHLQKPYAIANRKSVLDHVTLAQVQGKAGVLRARELSVLGREDKARAEWLTITQAMDDKERHAAAVIAIRWSQPNWAILALSKAENKDDLSLRFPLVHTQPFMQAAHQNKLEPALLFAIARQESAFVASARNSQSGAMGLMQLMPSTAKWLAKKHQMHYKGDSTLLEPETNIRFGAKYFKMLLEDHHQHAILAAAAYNAGPGRVKKWLPSFDMAADSWVETIPFKETREYVKNVMTYSVIYQQLLGQQNTHTIPLRHIPCNKI